MGVNAYDISRTEIDQAHERVAALLHNLPVKIERREAGVMIGVEGQILRARLDYLDSARAFVWFIIRTTSWDFGGERTDLHDLLSLTLAALLTATGGASCQLIDEVNPAGIPGLEDEIYARLLVPRQRGPVVELGRPEPLRQLLGVAWSMEAMMWRYLHLPEDCPCGKADEAALLPAEVAWEERVLRALRRSPSPRNFVSRRKWPEWQYLHVPRSAVTVAFAPQLATLLAAADVSQPRSAELTAEGQFVRAGDIGSLVAPSVLRRARHVLRQLRDLDDDEEPHLFPLEDRVVASGRRHLIALPADSGWAAFRSGCEQMQQRTRRQLAFFGVDRSFVWASPTPAGRFEEMVGELLERSGQVVWIRQVGATTERDRGRDFVAEWVTATSAEELPQGVSPQVRIDVVVQCKAVGRAVNVSDVPAIIELVEEHQAHGYFLAVSTRLTAPLVDRLTALRQRKRFEVVDWWGRTEIERELRGAPDLLARFADVVRPE
jgi:hypothetical protein